MKKYHRHSLALNDDEQSRFEKSGKGVKELFRAILDAVVPPGSITNTVEEEE